MQVPLNLTVYCDHQDPTDLLAQCFQNRLSANHYLHYVIYLCLTKECVVIKISCFWRTQRNRDLSSFTPDDGKRIQFPKSRVSKELTRANGDQNKSHVWTKTILLTLYSSAHTHHSPWLTFCSASRFKYACDVDGLCSIALLYITESIGVGPSSHCVRFFDSQWCHHDIRVEKDAKYSFYVATENHCVWIVIVDMKDKGSPNLINICGWWTYTWMYGRMWRKAV
jgi:hypothetical protein